MLKLELKLNIQNIPKNYFGILRHSQDTKSYKIDQTNMTIKNKRSYINRYLKF